MHREFAAAVLRSEPLGAVGQLGAEAAAMPDVLDQLGHTGLLAEMELRVEHAALDQFHRERQRCAEADRVHAEVVGVVVPLGHLLDVADLEVRSEQRERFVLGTLHDADAFHLDVATAGDRAVDAARLHALQFVVFEELARDVHRAVEVALLEVARRQDVAAVGGVDDAAGAEALHALAEDRMIFEEFAHFLRVGLELLGILHVQLARAAHRDGLQQLRSHHGADARASRDALVADDAGEEHEVLARRPDHRVLVFARQQLLRGVGALAPQIVGVEELDRVAVAVDLEAHPAIRAVLDDQDVDAGLFHAERERAAAGRVADAAGQRALADHREAIRLRRDGAVQRTGRKDQQVLGTERIDAGWRAVVEQPGPVALAADVEARDLLIERREEEGSRPQIDFENAPGIALDHRCTPSR